MGDENGDAMLAWLRYRIIRRRATKVLHRYVRQARGCTYPVHRLIAITDEQTLPSQ